MIVNDSAGELTLTPRQFKASIKALGLSQGRAARLCGFHGSTAKKWASGARKVPEPVAIMLRLLQSGELTVEQLESVAKPAKGGRK
jgi:DNA-binding transcriptional regulator YiaG